MFSVMKGSNKSSLAVGLCLLSTVRHLEMNLLKDGLHLSGWVSC